MQRLHQQLTERDTNNLGILQASKLVLALPAILRLESVVAIVNIDFGKSHIYASSVPKHQGAQANIYVKSSVSRYGLADGS